MTTSARSVCHDTQDRGQSCGCYGGGAMWEQWLLAVLFLAWLALVLPGWLGQRPPRAQLWRQGTLWLAILAAVLLLYWVLTRD